MAKTLAVLANDIDHIVDRLQKAEARIDEVQKLMRWGMGAAAGMGVILTLILPKIGKVLGLS